jgi:hypothetical protein
LWIANTFCIAQSVVASSGAYHESSNATLSWTLGETITETNYGTKAILNQGVQQNYSFTIVKVYEKPETKVNINVFPNPTVDYVNISIENSNDQFEIAIFDLNGKILISKKMNGAISSFDIKKFAESNYFIKISNQKEEIIKTYKIIKTHN